MEEKGYGEENGEGEKRYRENRKSGMNILLVSLGCYEKCDYNQTCPFTWIFRIITQVNLLSLYLS